MLIYIIRLDGNDFVRRMNECYTRFRQGINFFSFSKLLILKELSLETIVQFVIRL